MKDPNNHPEMMTIIQRSDLEFEQDMDQAMWEEEYPLIPGIPPDGTINVAGLQIILDEEKLAKRVSPAMSLDNIVRLQSVESALRGL